jgi:hypothetical protein
VKEILLMARSEDCAQTLCSTPAHHMKKKIKGKSCNVSITSTRTLVASLLTSSYSQDGFNTSKSKDQRDFEELLKLLAEI